jgi:hypothetical protein
MRFCACLVKLLSEIIFFEQTLCRKNETYFISNTLFPISLRALEIINQMGWLAYISEFAYLKINDILKTIAIKENNKAMQIRIKSL